MSAIQPAQNRVLRKASPSRLKQMAKAKARDPHKW